ncbi:hypothetical protein [Fibrella aquatilis]|uniref:Uncharacterized protein n=1 Tax=Fibrella aquatilis TaxID=2817059 RepID=A0A939K2E9_9BACT|nr:hypothetical protein [Fibrella aquatilis]MBO0934493.1 hypothetical protein [Fibrella aquatilis]
MFPWLINVLIGIKVGFCSCTPEVHRLGVARVRGQYRVEWVGTLPKVVNESSGLARRHGPPGSPPTFWTHNDGGGRPTLYGITLTGTLIDSLPLVGAKNVDWEDLAQQDTTRLFIADVGNNANTRRDLGVYGVKEERKKGAVRRFGKEEGERTSPLRNSSFPNRRTAPFFLSSFTFSDQTAFPPPGRNFDCEAVFYARDSLFLLSKNRSGHTVRLYGMPAQPGNRALAPLDSVYIKSMVTGAAISPDYKTLAVLTYGKILFFDLSSPGPVRLRHPIACLRVPRAQTEALVYINNTDLLMTNEQGRIYRLSKRR